MAEITQDLGPVTAYGYAVEKGYTGTEDEYETLMANYATVGQQATTAATNASESATSAANSATSALSVANSLDSILGNFATYEDSDTASQSHSVGDYIVWKDKLLHPVTAAIAEDDTIAIGTNIGSATNIGDVMTSLSEDLTQLGSFTSGTFSQSVSASITTSVGTVTYPSAGTYLIISYMQLSVSGTGVYIHTLGSRTVRSTDYAGGGSINAIVTTASSTSATTDIRTYTQTACTVSGGWYAIRIH